MEAATGGRTAFILFTDIYRSTQLWEKFPREFGQSLERHNALVEETVLAHGGEIMKNLGDGYIAIFNTSDECMRSGVEVQRKLRDLQPLPDGSEILVRVVGHGGPLQPLAAGRGYFGRPLNRASRICQVCHPGQMLVSGEVAQALRGLPEEVQLFNLGSHHLRDLAEPETIHQVDHPQFALHKFPPLPTLGFRPNNLVYQPNEFIGRALEMAELKALLLVKKQRLITITAPGGYGKSRLATQLCANLLQEYENGVFEVLLAPVGSHERIVSTTADALGFQFYGRAEPKNQLIDYLREKQMLVLFDNFEHVMEGKALLGEILQHAPKVSLLVTSREPLRLQAEKVYGLEPLPVEASLETRDVARPIITGETPVPPPGVPSLQEELPEAVQLFVDRATLVKHDFALTAENFALVGAICTKLEGVPLAIEMAAGWADSFTMAELLAEVGQQLELTARMADVPKRQRSIRASLDWSYNLLTDEQREVLRAVSTFKGGFFYAAAEAVTVGRGPVPRREDGAPQVGALQKNLRKTLAQLSDKGWLFTREVRLGEQAPGKTRFFIRDAATHQYAFEKLKASTEYEQRILSHAKYFAELIKREGERLEGHGQLEALKVLGVELENIYEGLDTALTRENAKLLLPFAKHLVSYLDMVSKWLEGLTWYERMLEKALELEDAISSMHCQLGLSRMQWRIGKYKEAESGGLGAKTLAEVLGDRYAISTSLNSLGVVAHNQGRYEEAEKLYQESLQIFREIGDRRGIAASLHNLGVLAYNQGRYAEAVKLYEESLTISREIGDRWGIAQSLDNLGAFYIKVERFTDACKYLREALHVSREVGARDVNLEGLVICGNLLVITGRFRESAVLLCGAQRQAKEMNFHFDPMEQGLLDEGMAKLKDALAEEELAACRAQGEKMTLDELADYALKALEELEL
jgi:predicted ATPase/class 3 adenylate cyclase/tetratricopeptide (TPR) repeat protein